MVELLSKRRVVVLAVAASTLWGCGKDRAGEASAATTPVVVSVTPADPEVVAVNRLEGEAFSLAWKAGTGAAGTTATGQLVLTPKAPFKCNLEYPYKLKLTAPGGVALEKAEVTKPDMSVDAKQVAIPVKYTVPEQQQELEGQLAFSVCTDDKCLIERVQLKMTTQAL